MFFPRCGRYARAAFDFLIHGFAKSTFVTFATTTLQSLSKENDLAI